MSKTPPLASNDVSSVPPHSMVNMPKLNNNVSLEDAIASKVKAATDLDVSQC